MLNCKRLLLFSIICSGCSQLPDLGSSKSSQPAASAAQPTVKGVQPGFDANGEVVDASKVESGRGRQVKGINETDGEITGKPAPGSKFTQLQIGMGMRQVTDLIGQPTDQGAYSTGKSFIPFYHGGDTFRQELAYKGQGRLVFARSSAADLTSGRLIWIIHSANESGYR